MESFKPYNHGDYCLISYHNPEILKLFPRAGTQCAKLWLGRLPSLYFDIWCELSIQDNTLTPFLLNAKEEGFVLAAFWNTASFTNLSFIPGGSTGKKAQKVNQINLPFLNQPLIKWALAYVQLLQCHWTRMFPQILQHSSIMAVLLAWMLLLSLGTIIQTVK